MINLLRAHFARLWRRPLLYLCLAAMWFVGNAMVNGAVSDLRMGLFHGDSSVLWGQPLCGPGLLIGFACAALFGLFFGTEYDEHTIRNKLIAGHSRRRIYLSVLGTAMAAAVLLYLAALVPVLMRPRALEGVPAPGAARLLLSLAGTALLVMALCSVCVLFCMLVHKRAILAVFLLLFMAALFAVSMQVEDAYQSATMGGMMMYIGENGPEYIFHAPESAGRMLMFLYDFLPICQAHRYMELDASPVMLVCSVLLTAVTTGAGLFLFQRKNIS